MTRVVLSEAARFDRREITSYTVRRFGLSQARRLRDRFQAALNTLAGDPLIGRGARTRRGRCGSLTEP